MKVVYLKILYNKINISVSSFGHHQYNKKINDVTEIKKDVNKIVRLLFVILEIMVTQNYIYL